MRVSFLSKRRINLIAIDSNDSIEILNGGISSGEISAEQMKQWETGRYFLMDITPSVTKKQAYRRSINPWN